MATKKKAQKNAQCTGFRAEIHAALMAGDYDAYRDAHPTGCATREEFTAAAAALGQIEFAMSVGPLPPWLHDRVMAMGASARDVEGADGKRWHLVRWCQVLLDTKQDGDALDGSCKRLGELLSSSWPGFEAPSSDAFAVLVKEERAKPNPGASLLAARILELAGIREGRNGTAQGRKAIATAVSRHEARRRKGS